MTSLFDRISSPDGLLELARFIEELNARVERLERSAADAVALYDAEAERQGRWWRTHDAYVTGACTTEHVNTDDLVLLHDDASRFADLAHGPLQPKG